MLHLVGFWTHQLVVLEGLPCPIEPPRTRSAERRPSWAAMVRPGACGRACGGGRYDCRAGAGGRRRLRRRCHPARNGPPGSERSRAAARRSERRGGRDERTGWCGGSTLHSGREWSPAVARERSGAGRRVRRLESWGAVPRSRGLLRRCRAGRMPRLPGRERSSRSPAAPEAAMSEALRVAAVGAEGERRSDRRGSGEARWCPVATAGGCRPAERSDRAEAGGHERPDLGPWPPAVIRRGGTRPDPGDGWGPKNKARCDGAPGGGGTGVERWGRWCSGFGLSEASWPSDRV